MSRVLVSSKNSLSMRLFDLDLQEDLDEIYSIDQDPLVMKYLTKGKTTTKEDFDRIWLPRLQSYTNPEKGFGMWRVALQENDQCVGELIARPMEFYTDTPHYHDIELGWRFVRTSWGKGYATEAAQTIIEYLSKKPEIKQFSAIADSANSASIKVMKNLGMRFVKHYIHSDPIGDSEVDCYRLIIKK